MSEAALLPDGTRVVTFDIFDTLLHRRLRAPVDVFELVRLKAFETDFALLHHDFLDGYAAARREAEARARKQVLKDAEEGEIVLDEIFAQLEKDHGLPHALVDFLKRTELELEEAVLFASPEGLHRYHAARQKGLPVAFVSDMYLPSAWISAKLVREGFEGADTLPLYVSGEHRASKRSGRLYRKVAQEQGWDLDGSWLHVGDNRKADIEAARSLGLETELASWADVRNVPQPEESDFGLNAISAIMAFTEFRPSQAGQPTDVLEQIGYRTFGPLLFGFTLWLLTRSRNRGLDRLLFVARDGLLPKDLFDMLKDRAGCGHVTTEYFYLSRKAGYLTGMREWDREQTRRITRGRRGKTARRSFRGVGLDAEAYREDLARFGIPDIDEIIPPEKADKVIRALDAVFPEVLRSNAAAREALQSYYLDALGGEAPIGFVDIGWVGNIQRLFVNSLPDSTARERVFGLYLGQLPSCSFNEARGIRMESFMTRGRYRAPIQKALHIGGLELLEFAMTADHGTTILLEPDGDGKIRPVLEDRSQEEKDYAARAMRVQDGIRRYAADHAWLLDHFDGETLALPHWAQPLLQLVTEPTPEEVAALADLTHSDALGSNSERLPLVVPLTGLKCRSPSHRREAREKSFWKAGFDSLYNKKS